jgi:hypothetical protein
MLVPEGAIGIPAGVDQAGTRPLFMLPFWAVSVRSMTS